MPRPPADSLRRIDVGAIFEGQPVDTDHAVDRRVDGQGDDQANHSTACKQSPHPAGHESVDVLYQTALVQKAIEAGRLRRPEETVREAQPELLHWLDPQQGSVLFFREHVKHTVRTLAYIADALP